MHFLTFVTSAVNFNAIIFIH